MQVDYQFPAVAGPAGGPPDVVPRRRAGRRSTARRRTRGSARACCSSARRGSSSPDYGKLQAAAGRVREGLHARRRRRSRRRSATTRSGPRRCKSERADDVQLRATPGCWPRRCCWGTWRTAAGGDHLGRGDGRTTGTPGRRRSTSAASTARGGSCRRGEGRVQPPGQGRCSARPLPRAARRGTPVQCRSVVCLHRLRRVAEPADQLAHLVQRQRRVQRVGEHLPLVVVRPGGVGVDEVLRASPRRRAGAGRGRTATPPGRTARTISAKHAERLGDVVDDAVGDDRGERAVRVGQPLGVHRSSRMRSAKPGAARRSPGPGRACGRRGRWRRSSRRRSACWRHSSMGIWAVPVPTSRIGSRPSQTARKSAAKTAVDRRVVHRVVVAGLLRRCPSPRVRGRAAAWTGLSSAAQLAVDLGRPPPPRRLVLGAARGEQRRRGARSRRRRRGPRRG